MKKAELFQHVIAYFEAAMPVAQTELHYNNPFELLVSVILSAQCTDKRVNMVTPALFKKFPTAKSMSEASVDEVREYIKSISYPNSKAEYLVKGSKILAEKFKSEIPSTIEELTTIPGVGRKTANVILSVIYSQPKMAVDTHVFRVAARIGLTTGAKNPLQTEMQLIKYFPEDKIPLAHHWLILHGRYICLARKPLCEKCGLTKWCKYYNQKIKDKK
ncbi:MAG TPA: endonuclease III [Bacteroidia bacterium]|jgi:endonuclease-3|nr:endonuclease III [Bacteroidia bacterium]